MNQRCSHKLAGISNCNQNTLYATGCSVPQSPFTTAWSHQAAVWSNTLPFRGAGTQTCSGTLGDEELGAWRKEFDAGKAGMGSGREVEG